MAHVEFRAPEYHANQSFQDAVYRYDGSTAAGWTISRNDELLLTLGPGYRLLKTERCGICSTDLARHCLPFPLPQITGHELIATDESGRRFVVEINASHRARGVPSDCPFCAGGLHTHCPQRIVLGIHDLPGGFGPWVLAPVNAALPVPDAVPSRSAVLIEPFAAALNAVATIAPRDGDRIAVLGPRRLGMLVVAALHAHRERNGQGFEILALSRHPDLLELSRRFGATETRLVEADGGNLPSGLADIVIDTTGTPSGLELAIRLAIREVHLKSTHGQAAAGIEGVTELVVDEIALDRLPTQLPPDDQGTPRLGLGGHRPRVAWLTSAEPPAWLAERTDLVRAADAAAALRAIESATPKGMLPRADLVVTSDPRGVASAIRPRDDQVSLVRPRGDVLLHPEGVADDSPLCRAVLERGLRISSSRCGDFRTALALMAGDPQLRGIGELLVTHSFRDNSMAAAFAAARSPDCIKAVVEHGDGNQP